MKILITGGAGFVGRNLVRVLHSNNFQMADITILDSELGDGYVLGDDLYHVAAAVSIDDCLIACLTKKGDLFVKEYMFDVGSMVNKDSVTGGRMIYGILNRAVVPRSASTDIEPTTSHWLMVFKYICR